MHGLKSNGPDAPHGEGDLNGEHVNTKQCGFDRNASHSAGHYVCACGFEDESAKRFEAPSFSPPAPSERWPDCPRTYCQQYKVCANENNCSSMPLGEYPDSAPVSETTTNQRAACAEEGSGDSAKAKGPQDSPAAAHQTLLSATVAQPVVWRIRLGDSDTWGYCDIESDADFHIEQSGLAGVKQPLYAAPPVEAGAQTDAARYAWIRESVASHLLHYILRGWRDGMGNYDPDTPPDLIHECNERKRNELDAEIDAIRFQYETGE